MRNQIEKNRFERIAHRIAAWAGSPSSILIHTALFLGAFLLVFFGIDFDRVLLVVTTIVSLEAIYLSLFIQMTINWQAKHLKDVKENIEDLQEDIEDLSDDVSDKN